MPGDNRAHLIPAHPQNLSAVKSGIYSRTGRVLAPRAEAIADELMTLPHVHALDRIAAEEIGSVLAHLEAIDADLARRGPTAAAGARKTLLEHKARLSRELRTWLREFGGTPKARAEWASGLTSNLAAEIARRRAELNGEAPA